MKHCTVTLKDVINHFFKFKVLLGILKNTFNSIYLTTISLNLHFLIKN